MDTPLFCSLHTLCTADSSPVHHHPPNPDTPALCRLPAFCFPVCQCRVSCQHLWKQPLLLYKYNEVCLICPPRLRASINAVCACVCALMVFAWKQEKGSGFVGFYFLRPNSYQAMPRLDLLWLAPISYLTARLLFWKTSQIYSHQAKLGVWQFNFFSPDTVSNGSNQKYLLINAASLMPFLSISLHS